MDVKAIVKGKIGELKTQALSTLLLDSKYRIFNNVIVKDENGNTTQIDHVIIGDNGIFVVETKEYTGQIYGTEKEATWTKVIYKRKDRIPNPLRQNYRHKMVLAEYLGVEKEKIFSLIVFWGECEFVKDMPENVIKADVLKGNYTGFIKSRKKILFSIEELNRLVALMREAKDSQGILSGYKHVKGLKERYSSETVCPKCGGTLIERVAQKGIYKGQRFIGCSNFPKCKYRK